MITWVVSDRGPQYKQRWEIRYFEDDRQLLLENYTPKFKGQWVWWKRKKSAINHARWGAKVIYNAMNEKNEEVRGTYP